MIETDTRNCEDRKEDVLFCNKWSSLIRRIGKDSVNGQCIQSFVSCSSL